MTTRGFSGADVKFVAFHLDGQLAEGWHAHAWTVTCWVRFPPWRDLRSLREAMLQVVDVIAPEIDGVRHLDPAQWTNEAVGQAFLVLANVKWVHVDRPGFHTRMWR